MDKEATGDRLQRNHGRSSVTRNPRFKATVRTAGDRALIHTCAWTIIRLGSFVESNFANFAAAFGSKCLERMHESGWGHRRFHADACKQHSGVRRFWSSGAIGPTALKKVTEPTFGQRDSALKRDVRTASLERGIVVDNNDFSIPRSASSKSMTLEVGNHF